MRSLLLQYQGVLLGYEIDTGRDTESSPWEIDRQLGALQLECSANCRSPHHLSTIVDRQISDKLSFDRISIV